MPTTILDGETYEQARHRRFTEEAKVIEKMQQDEIIRMAREACAPNQTFNSDEEWVKRFAALVAANLFTYDQVKAHIQAAVITEREACAKVCEKLQNEAEAVAKCFDATAEECAEAIRARGEK